MREMLLERMRSMCLPLPGVSEAVGPLQPTFLVGARNFAVLADQQGCLCLAVKVGSSLQATLLAREHFVRTPYVGKHGWVSLQLEGAVDWKQVHGLILHSYRLVAPARARRILDGDRTPL
ncbi:MAG: MmcQ/YjbR family DNA-binding protein [Planctomycetota bacterium]